MRKIVFVVASFLAGCANTSTGPISAGADTYVIARQASAFGSGRETLLAEVLAEANSKCKSHGKSMKLISTVDNPGPYVLGNYPKTTVTFSCN